MNHRLLVAVVVVSATLFLACCSYVSSTSDDRLTPSTTGEPQNYVETK